MNTPEHNEIITSGDRPNIDARVALIQITTAFFRKLSLSALSSCVTKKAKKPLRNSRRVCEGGIEGVAIARRA
jgi:hypothetical protein